MNRWGVGKPTDEHRCTYTKRGKRCWKWRSKGKRVCWKHGVGSKKRVADGRRKPAGGQIRTGAHVDPDTIAERGPGFERVRELYNQHLADPELLSMRKQVALAKAFLDWLMEEFESGKWNVVKTMTATGELLLEHPGTTMIKQASVVQGLTQQALVATFRDEIRAACELLKPVLVRVQDAIDRFVPEPERVACRRFIQESFRGVMG